MRQVVRILSGSLLLLMTLWSAPTPRSAWAEEPASADTLVLAKDTSVHEFLSEVSKRRPGLLFWNPNDKQIRDRTIAAGTYSVADADLLPLLRRLLAFYELAVVPMGPKGRETHFVIDARQGSTLMKLKAEPIVLTPANLAHFEAQDGLFVTTVLPVPSLENPRDLRQAISRLVTQQNIGNVTELPEGRALVVTDFAPTVVGIYRLVQQLEAAMDQHGTATETRLLPLKHTNAHELASLLAMLLAPRPPTPLTPAQQQAQAAQGGSSSPASIPSGVRLVPEQRTNQILARGTPAQVEEVARLVAALDVQVVPPAPVSAHVIQLRRASANRLSNLLNSLAQSNAALWSGSDARGSRPSFLGDERTNSLVVSATESAIAAIRALVKELDQEGDSPK